ncbi:hypothetical protein ACLKA7_010904 [Drosophila subpalustris]
MSSGGSLTCCGTRNCSAVAARRNSTQPKLKSKQQQQLKPVAIAVAATTALSGLVIKDNDNDNDVAGGRGEFCESRNHEITKDRQLAQSLVVVSVRAQLVDVLQPERLLDVKTKTKRRRVQIQFYRNVARALGQL